MIVDPMLCGPCSQTLTNHRVLRPCMDVHFYVIGAVQADPLCGSNGHKCHRVIIKADAYPKTLHTFAYRIYLVLISQDRGHVGKVKTEALTTQL